MWEGLGLGVPRAGFTLLMGRGRAQVSQGSQGKCWPAGGWAGPDTAGCRAAVVLGLVSSHWRAGLGPRGSWGSCLLTGGWIQVLGSLVAGPSVSQGYCLYTSVWGWVLGPLVGHVLGWLWAQGFFK